VGSQGDLMARLPQPLPEPGEGRDITPGTGRHDQDPHRDDPTDPARRKESYVGTWLPEPLLTAPDVADDAELADSVSMAMLLVLETLAPTERAVFVLREVFALEYGEIAEAVGKSPAAVRQIAHRARAHVAARRPRGVVSPAQARDALAACAHAARRMVLLPQSYLCALIGSAGLLFEDSVNPRPAAS